MVDPKDVLKLKGRFQTVQIEMAKAEERRKASKAALKIAREGLANLGIDPDEAEEAVTKLYKDIERRIVSMEEWLGIS